MLKKLQENRLEAITKARGILDTADEEKRSLTTEEREQYDKWDSEIDRIDTEITEVLEDSRRRSKLEAQEERAEEGEERSVPAEQPSGLFAAEPTEKRTGTASAEYASAWWNS